MRTDYEALAAQYDDDRATRSFRNDDVITELLGARAAHATMRVLDLGTGTGRWLAAQQAAFVDAAIDWLGLDPSQAMLAAANAKGIGNLACGRAEDLPLPDASIDYVATSFTFHHFDAKERALDEIRRVLDQDGVFRINNIEPADGWWLYDFFPETTAIDAARFWPASRIGYALEARDFTVEIVLDTGAETLPAVDALAEAERRVVSQLAVLDDTAYARGLARLRDAAAAPGATVTTTRSLLRLTARR